MNIQLKMIMQLVPLLFIFVSNIIATPRNSREALRIAMSFYQKNPVSTKSILQGTSTLQLAYTCSDVATRSSDNNGYYYVFNIGNIMDLLLFQVMIGQKIFWVIQMLAVSILTLCHLISQTG